MASSALPVVTRPGSWPGGAAAQKKKLMVDVKGDCSGLVGLYHTTWPMARACYQQPLRWHMLLLNPRVKTLRPQVAHSCSVLGCIHAMQPGARLLQSLQGVSKAASFDNCFRNSH
jgi:hypothetical protein